MTLDPAAEEPKQEAPKEEKPPPWAPPPQHNFMKNWQRNLALWKRQQEALSSEQRGWAPAGPTRHPGPAARRVLSLRPSSDGLGLSVWCLLFTHSPVSLPGRVLGSVRGGAGQC